MSEPASPLRRLIRQIPGARALAGAVRRRIDPELRAIEAVRARHRGVVLQPFTDTWDERYPALFDALAGYLSALPAPRVLSFGCASGAEVRAMRRRLPHARITGIDLNPRALAAARAADPGGDYRELGAPPGDERYDAILALAVLRHGVLERDRPASCAGVLPFAQAEAALLTLDAALEPGGWLAIWNAHFRLADTAFAPRYAADPLRIDEAPQEPIYGPDDRLLDGAREPAILFRKLA